MIKNNTDSEGINKVFRDSDNWNDVNVIQYKFEWLSGAVAKLEKDRDKAFIHMLNCGKKRAI